MNFKLQKILAWPTCLILLVGIIAAGNNTVLCIGGNGIAKFKTLCLLYCAEADVSCEDGLLDGRQVELANCSHCSDVELDGPLRSNRILRTNSYQLGQFALELANKACPGQVSIMNGSLRNKIVYLTYVQSPPSYSIISLSTTVIRC